jgi:predicted ATP-grasp superfamily ATP-dependent carboligase
VTKQGTPRVPVLILGTHITALGVLRLLAARRLETYVVDATSDIIVRSRWYRPTERTLLETADSDELDRFLRSIDLPGAVLIATSDRWTLAGAGLPLETRQRYLTSMPPREAVEQFVDKDRFRALVNRLGIPHPRTRPLLAPADLDLVTDDDLRSGFLKPTDSQRFYRQFGTKGAFVHSRQAAAHLMEQAGATGITFMLQEWIPGNMSKTILIDGFVDRNGTIAAMVARRRIRTDPPRIANTASDVTIPLAEVSEVVGSVEMLLAEVHYRGVFNVEFKFDERDRRFKIIEVNPRPFWLIGHIAKAGVDLPWMIYQDAQELPVAVSPPYRTGRYGLYELPDAAALLRAWSSFHRAEGPVLGPWLKGDHALFWWSDPMPAAVDVWRALQRRIGGAFARLRRSRGGAA